MASPYICAQKADEPQRNVYIPNPNHHVIHPSIRLRPNLMLRPLSTAHAAKREVNMNQSPVDTMPAAQNECAHRLQSVPEQTIMDAEMREYLQVRLRSLSMEAQHIRSMLGLAPDKRNRRQRGR